MIYIIRHGQTEKNKAKVLQGRSNVPLNEAGIKQAEEVRDKLRTEGIHFDKIYTSPLIRAIQTAEIITGNTETITEVPNAASANMVIDERLIEMDYGPYEGMDLQDPAPEVMTFFSDFVNNPAPEGMEPLQEIVSRLGEFLDTIKEEAAKQNILISTHAIAMKGALEYLTPESSGSYWSKYIANCEVYKAEVTEDGEWTIPKSIL